MKTKKTELSPPMVDCCQFECCICMDKAKSPVVTLCGHLFCWPCLYHWFEMRGRRSACPFCKSRINQTHVVALYGKQKIDANYIEDKESQTIVPPRPVFLMSRTRNDEEASVFSDPVMKPKIIFGALQAIFWMLYS